MIEQMRLAGAGSGMRFAVARLDAVPRPGGEYAMDAKQSDVAAGYGGVRGGRSVRAWSVGESHGHGADRGGHRAGRTRRAPRSEEKNGHAAGRAIGHPRRPHDRERLLHIFCCRGDGVAVAAGFVFCARGGDRFSAWVGDQSGPFRLGRERDAADLVGSGAGGVALEPRIVCGDEVSVLLLFGFGVGADARAGRAGGRLGGGCARHDSCGGACADVDDGGILPAAWIAGAGGRVEIFCRERGAGAQSEERVPQQHPGCKNRSAGGGMKVRKEVKEIEEVNGAKEHERNIAAFFDLNGTLLAPPSLERRFFRMLRYRREIPTTNYFLWLMEALRLLPRGVNAILHANKMYLQGVHIL